MKTINNAKKGLWKTVRDLPKRWKERADYNREKKLKRAEEDYTFEYTLINVYLPYIKAGYL
jgi:hypothetical protein